MQQFPMFPYFPTAQMPVANQQVPMQPVLPSVTPSGGLNVPGMLPAEESYIENILRLNKGKLVHLHSTFEHNREWNAKIFTGVIEAAGRDHVIISDPETGKRFLIPMVYVDFVTFDEPIDYDYQFGVPLANYSPR